MFRIYVNGIQEKDSEINEGMNIRIESRLRGGMMKEERDMKNIQTKYKYNIRN